MIRFLPAFLLLLFSCKHLRPISGDAVAHRRVPVETERATRNEWTVQTAGDPYQLNLKQGRLMFCDDGGGRLLDLETGADKSSVQKCVKPLIFHGEWTGCTDASLNMMVQSPQNDPNDNIVFGRSAYPLQGRVGDCDNDGTIGVIGTAEEVLLIDGERERWAVLSKKMGQPVAIGSGWIAWCPSLEHKLHLVRQSTAVWQMLSGTQ